jgi:hypothetical protein
VSLVEESNINFFKWNCWNVLAMRKEHSDSPQVSQNHICLRGSMKADLIVQISLFVPESARESKVWLKCTMQPRNEKPDERYVRLINLPSDASTVTILMSRTFKNPRTNCSLHCELHSHPIAPYQAKVWN